VLYPENLLVFFVLSINNGLLFHAVIASHCADMAKQIPSDGLRSVRSEIGGHFKCDRRPR